MLSGCNAMAKVVIVSAVKRGGLADVPPSDRFDGERFAAAASGIVSLRDNGDLVRKGLTPSLEGWHVTLPSASSPNDRPRDTGGEADAPGSDRSPPAGAVSLADLIADSGPLPADAALECVQRIAERLTNATRGACAHLEPADVFVDDDGGVWIDNDGTPGSLDPPLEVLPINGMDRLGKLLAFVATGDGSHLDDGAKVDPATLPPPLSGVASRLFSRNGACFRSYADLAREVARLRVIGGDNTAFQNDAPAITAREQRHAEPAETTPLPSVTAAPTTRLATPAADSVPESHPEPAESNPRFAIAMAVVFVLGALVAFLIWQLL
jgi:hypothetical protein